MNRRSFLAAPLIVRPSLEDIERLTWRRRFFPGYTPPFPDPQFDAMIRAAVEHMAELFDAYLLEDFRLPDCPLNKLSVTQGPLR